MRRKRLLWVAAIAVIAVVLVLVFRPRHQDAAQASSGPPVAQVALVQNGSVSHVLTLAGEFQPYQVVEVHPKVSGFIRHIYVDIGDRVHRGETLATLEVPELQAQVQGTVFSIAQSKAEIVRAQNEVQRAQSEHAALHDEDVRLQQTAKAQPGLIAQQELDDAQAKDLSSEAQVDAAKSALAAAEQGVQVAQADNQRVSAIQRYTNVTAPLDGVIIWRYADTGALIQAGTNSDTQDLPIVKLSQSGLLRLRVPVPEDAVRYVHIGDPMQVRVDALGRSFTGKVVRFTRDVSAETRTMQTEIDVENKNLAIDPGMYANTQLQLAHVANVPTLATDALLRQGDGWIAYALDQDNRVHIRPVQIGVQGSTLTQVVSGLQPGDRVILGGQAKYEAGERVKPLIQPEPTSDVTREAGGEIDLNAPGGNR